VLTDSGGIQEETTALGVRCLTLRRNTERPVTVDEGTNELVECSTDAVLEALRRAPKNAVVPQLWDGHAATRLVDVLATWASGR
ncbi:MAG: UDP-N-acetylglucosamine 2-epimerase, partial [Polyangiales bacterium]